MRVREARKNEWISTETRRLVNERVSERRDLAKGQAIKRGLGHAIKPAWRRIGYGAQMRRGNRWRRCWGRTHP